MNRPRIISLALTAIIAALIVLLMVAVKITVDTSDRQWPPRHDGEVLLAEEEQFFDVVTDDVELPLPAEEEAAPAPAEVVENLNSTPAPASGTDTKNAGKPAEAPAPVTTKKPSTVKQPVKEQPKQTGPSAEEIAQEEARRRANNATKTAFQNTKGKDNTANKGKNEGDSGSPNGSSTTFNGSGTGTATGGWSLPTYQKIRSTVTGEIRVRVTILRDGSVGSLTFQGGTPPAYSDAALRQRVEAEIRSRRFTRKDNNAPDQATARITYIFK